MNPENERERSVERLLRESLATSPSTPGTGSCLDAETLAAWLDGGLAGGQLTAAQEHVAGCGMCQATLAAVVRTTPIQRGPEPWWRRALGARWLVPVAATATALAIWVVVPRDEFVRPPEEPQTAARAAAAPQTEASAPPTVAPAEKSAAETSIAAPRPLEQSNTVALRGDRAQGAAAPDAREEQRDAVPPVLQRRDLEPKVDAPVNPVQDGARAPQGAPPAPLGRAAAAAPEPAAPAADPAQTARSQVLMERADFAVRAEIASPGTAFRWRIGPAGTVEFSPDAGSTWETRPSGVDVDLTAGASPSGTVCWVVGRAGTVLLTVDGRQWRRLAFPLPVDLSAVQASDARTAIVTTVDGRRFRTVDGGATWEVR